MAAAAAADGRDDGLKPLASGADPDSPVSSADVDLDDPPGGAHRTLGRGCRAPPSDSFRPPAPTSSAVPCHSRPSRCCLPARTQGQILARPALAIDGEVAVQASVAPLRPKRRLDPRWRRRLWQVHRLRVVADVADGHPRFHRGAPTWRRLDVAATRRSVGRPPRSPSPKIGSPQLSRPASADGARWRRPIDPTVGRRTHVVRAASGPLLRARKTACAECTYRSADSSGC